MSDIAVIGIGCRFPGNSDTPEKFWNNLVEGRDLTSDVEDERWSKRKYYNKNKRVPGKLYTIHGGFIKDIDKFDPGFFGISPREANYMDPQQRILLEVTHEAMQDGGIIPEKLREKNVGVYVGAFTVDYQLLAFNMESKEKIDVYSSAGNMMTMLSNRISYLYDLKGPSMTIDTACSSSLVATHTACEAIKNGDCEMALVAGVNIMITPTYTVSECKGGFLSPDGRCKAFDSSANGYARGEGAGVVILKSLDKALEDGNYIYSVIKATGSNQDGRTDGITVPNGDSQEKLLKETCRKANIKPSDITYVEAHGTGTAVGDPIEANAIGNVVKEGRENKKDCIIGSVKTNMGHLEAASGIASLIKACLMLKNKKIPPHLHLKNPNPKINFRKLRLKVNTELNDFKSDNGRLLIGVNSFGFGGTNANVILENFEGNSEQEEVESAEELNIATISAKSKEALNNYVSRIKDCISNKNVSYKDVLYTLSNGRSHYENRLAFPVISKEQMIQYINDFLNDTSIRKDMFYGESIFRGKENVVFVYTGMGPIWWAMGRELLKKQKVFRESVKKCDELIKEYTGWSILEKMLASEEDSELDMPQYAQPANFVLQVALTDLWRSYGIEANAIVGHSVGEVAAAYASGSLTLEQSVKVSIERSKAQQKMVDKGTMMHVEISEEEGIEILKDYEGCVSIGVVNSENSITLSGNRKELEEIQNKLNDKGIFSKFLKVNVAYHSCQMDTLKDDFEKSIKGLVANQPKIPIYSTVTGEKNDGGLYGKDYWWGNVRQTVRFKEAVNNVLGDGYNLFIEIGPHPVLKSSILESITRKNVEGEVIHSLIRKEDEENTFYSSLAHMYTLGYTINIDKIAPVGSKFAKIPLYPWQHKSYWNETEESKEMRTAENDDYILGRKLKAPVMTWENDISYELYPYLKDHKVQNAVLFPGAGYIEMALSFVRSYAPNDACEIRTVNFKKAMFLKENRDTHIKFIFHPEDCNFEIFSTNFEDAGNWELNATGTIRQCLNPEKNNKLDIKSIKKECSEEMNKELCYKMFVEHGFQYGEKFQNIEKIYKGNNAVLSYLNLCDEEFLNYENHVMHATIIDACFQGMISVMSNSDNKNKSFLPTNVENILVYNKPQKNMVAYTFITSTTEKYMKGDIILCDMLGSVILKMQGFTVRNTNNDTHVNRNALEQSSYDFQWYNAEAINKLGYQAALEEQSSNVLNKKGIWIIFDDKADVGKKLTQSLSERNQKCINVITGEEYKVSEGEEIISINPSKEEEFDRLLSYIVEKSDLEICGVVHLWNLKAENESNDSIDAKYIEKFQSIGCMSIIHFIKACEKKNLLVPIWIITRGVQAINNEIDVKSLPQSPVWGLGRIIAYQEYPDMFGALIDLDPSHPSDEIKFIIDEIQNGSCENQIAFRNGVKYFPRIVKSDIQQNKIPSKFDCNKSYLITGGFGALGKLVIEFMVKRGARRFILFSRTKLLDRREWKNVERGTELESRIDFIKDMERMGATLHIAAVDVSNFDELKQYINDYYEAEWPEIGGVIHCAGIIKDKLISNMTEADFNSVLKPKVGAWNLHRVFENSELNFFILFSSVASAINITMGQANYASANSFMDVLSSYRKTKGLPSISINWGPWGDVGMASENDLVGYFRSKGIESTTPKQGIEVIENILNYNKSQIVILNAQWNVLERSFSKKSIPASIFYLCKQNGEESKEEENNSNGMILKDILALTNPVEKKEKLREYLIEVITKLFGANVGELNNDKSLVEMGMDSLMATDIKRSIESVFNVKISMVELMQGISINELSDKVLESSLNNKGKEMNENEDTNIKVQHNTEDCYEPFPLTDVQMAYFTGRKDDFVLGGVSPHMYMELSTHMDIEKFNESLNKLIEIHPMLRTVFLENGMQKIMEDTCEYIINVKDIRDYSKELKDKEIMNLRDKLSHKVFNPLKWPLFQISGLKLSNEETYLFIGFDMLITDGTSWRKIGDDLSNIYYNKGKNIEKIDFNYKDFMVGYEKLKATKAYEIDKKYWLSKLNTFPKSPSIEFKVLPQNIEKSHFKRLRKVLDKDEFKKLKQLSNEHGISISVLFCTVYAMVLSYWSNQDNLGLNVTVFNRQPFNDEVYKLIGDFTSLILLEVDFSEEGSFWDKAKRVNKSLSEALEHRLFDGVEFMRELGKRNDIFDGLVMPVVFTSMISEDGSGLNGWTSFGTIENSLSQTPQVYLDNQLIEIDGKLNIVLDYVENLFYEQDIENMYDKYIEAVHLLANKGDISNVHLPNMDEEVILSYNSTNEAISSNITLQELFVNQVKKTPNKTAVKFENKTITYKELDEKSNLVAIYLKQQGVKPADRVAIIAKRGLEAIINIIGIIKLGAAYVPVNEDYPQDRIDYIMENAKCTCIIDNYLPEKVDLSIYGREMIELDNEFNTTAYIIYTSGSTGRPKGVAITHKAVVNTILDINRKFHVTEEDKIIGLSSMNFDLSIYDIFGALVSGATLVMIPDIKDVENIMNTIKKEEITIWNSVPSIMGVLLESFKLDRLFSHMEEDETVAVDYDGNKSLRLVMLSGDWIPLDLPEKITCKFINAKVVSLGGATEASIWSIHYIINRIDKSWKSIPYGMPLANQNIYILNNKIEVCPVNVQGEIYIGGKGVALEYFSDVEKTEKAFINHPTLGRIYKTGDYGIFRREGYVEFLGRKDNQVKINGNRVELGEVEKCLKDIDGVKNAVVVDCDSKNSKYLCAYVISDEKLEYTKIKNYLSKQLPEYMIPLQYISIDHIPLSANGKVDRNALPEANSIELDIKYAAPRNEIEKVLQNICKEILEIDENISINESLYNWGWNSIKMILFSSKVKNHFNIEIPFAVLSKYANIKKIGEFILNRNGNSEEIYQIFNEKSSNKIFAFPPLLTFGIVYKEISKVIDNQAIYAFDYINEDNIFDIYVDKILELEKKGPYNFIGYSCGGNVAYEVAKRLESRGMEVENIILIDTSYGVGRYFENMEQELIDDFKMENIDIVLNKLMKDSSDKAIIRSNLEKRIDQYIKILINKCSTDKKVNSKLYYIEANETVQDHRSKVRYMDVNWRNITKEFYCHYDGYGNHGEMMFGDFAIKNADIINKILSKS